jgi:predicted permease
LVPADESPGAPPVVILNYRFWVNRFAARRDIVGRTVQIDNEPVNVIGVMPEGFDFPEQQNLWMPLSPNPELRRREPGGYMSVGRLAKGGTAKSARAELEAINRNLAAAYTATNKDVIPRVDTYSQFFVGPDGTVIYGSLWAAAWFVLLIACANLANLTLARTIGRSPEFSTRLALGAGRSRMVRQMLTESFLLAGAGGLLAWWVTNLSVRTWAAATENRYQILDYTLGHGTILYLIAISLAAALLFSMVPIARILHLDVNGTLKGDARGLTHSLRAKYLSAALVAGQMALAIILLAGTGIIVRSFLNVVRADVGVRFPEQVLTGLVTIPSDKYPTPESRIRFFDLLKTRLEAIPGIESATTVNILPVDNPSLRKFELEQSPTKSAVMPVVIGPDYLRALGATLTAGSEMNPADRAASLPVVMVNQSFASKFWPGMNPLGKRLRLFDRDQPGEWRTVVGVISNIMQGNATRQRFLPVVYLPFRQAPAGQAWVLVRSRVSPDQVAAAVRTEIQQSGEYISLETFSTLQASFAFRRDRMDVEHAEMGKNAALSPIFAVIALLLAVVGLYAVMAHSVSQRTKEIGVRMAIGAAIEDIRRLVFRQGMTPVALGLLLGLVASAAVNRILQSQLVGVSPYDPVTMAGAPVVLIAVALLGCQIPARRATRVDPAVALRHD